MSTEFGKVRRFGAHRAPYEDLPGQTLSPEPLRLTRPERATLPLPRGGPGAFPRTGLFRPFGAGIRRNRALSITRSLSLSRGFIQLTRTIGGEEGIFSVESGKRGVAMSSPFDLRRTTGRGFIVRPSMGSASGFSVRANRMRLAPADAGVLRVSGRRGGHGVEPPALFGSQADPVADGVSIKARVGLLDGPGQDQQLLAQEPFDPVGPNSPTAGFEALGAEPLVELALHVLGDGVPGARGKWQRSATSGRPLIPVLMP